MKRVVILLLRSVLTLTSSISYSQTITSTATGGDWEARSTWVGNAVPGASNDVIIAGTVSVTSSASTCRNLTINSGSTLQNGGSLGWVTFVVGGNFTNNGTLRDNPTANTFCLDLRGDIANSGIWRPSNTYIATKRVQHLSMASGTRFDGSFTMRDGNGYVDTNGSLIASSDLTFTGRFDLRWRSIDLNGHKLTLQSQANLSWGTIANVTDIYSRDSSYFYNVTIAGTSTTLHGRTRIDAAVNFTANIINEDTVEHSGSLGWVTPVIYGDFTNNGLLRNNPLNGWQLVLDLRGDIRNNGTWTPGATYIATKKLQHISAALNKPFRNGVTLRDGSGYVDTNGALVATSDLIFTDDVDLRWRSIDMDSHVLTLIEHGHLGWGTISNVPSIQCRDSSFFYNTIVGSDVVLHGTAHIDGAVTFLGNVIVEDTMQHWGGLGWVTPEIHGSFVNNGVVRNNPANNWGLAVKVWKDVTNNGVWTATQLILDGTARRTISMRNATGTRITIYGKKVALAGNNYVPTLEMSSGAMCYVASEATLYIEDGTTNYGWNGVDNLGRIIIPKKSAQGTTKYDFYSGSLYWPSGSALPDSMIVESYGRQTPKQFGNAVERWFRMRTVPQAEYTLQYLDIAYGQMDVNGISEKDLRLYRSTDQGVTWIMIDNANLVYIDSGANYLRYKDVACSGDYVLGPAGTMPIPSFANVRATLIGNSDVRVGAPNRLLVHLYNNSDAESGDLFVTLDANEKLRFLKLEDEVDGVPRVFTLDDFASDSTDQSVLLLTRSLGPREERDITMYVTTFSTSSISSKSKDPQVFWFLGVAVVYVAGAYISDYITDKMVEGCFDLWMPAGASAADKALAAQDIKTALKEGAKKAGVATGKQLAEDGAKRILANKGLEHLVWPAKLGYNILSCVENTIKGTQCYLGQTMIRDVFTHVECNGSQKEVRPVTSKDPNHKSGPNGYGAENYIARTQRMDYMIEFENAPNAQAPAYKIVVLDTLSDSFDPSTVVFGRMSHAFTATRSGNVLRWEITGIDLPPNQTPTEGEGWLTFSVLPRVGLSSGVQLGNHASITFDLNAPILTNSYTNTLDFSAPVTVMHSLPGTTPDSVVTVRWSSADVGGSGYEGAELFMAVDDAGYTAIAAQDADSARVMVQRGHTYSFFALSKDHVGNVETERPLPVSIRATSGVGPTPRSSFWIREPYPNPSTSAIAVEFSIPAAGHVQVSVFNVLGSEVGAPQAILASEGLNVIQIETANLVGGTYYVRVAAGAAVRTRAFVVGQ